MLRRLLLGLVEGLLLGVALGVAYCRVFGAGAPSAVVTALLGAVVGFAIGLVAGRPIWARDAKTEALLKSLAGALAGLGLAFALRHWLKLAVDLSALSLGTGSAGELPATSLPLIATALALFFELDDDGTRASRQTPKTKHQKQRLANDDSDAIGAREPEEFDDEVDRKFEKR
ncbi:MAG TPA: hypothetical protein VHV51_19495 [Polyangiaceae bacterium]|jgi:hypothetical protein|nr:hypothetical protein [Polyangiaceae bacterium]